MHSAFQDISSRHTVALPLGRNHYCCTFVVVISSTRRIIPCCHTDAYRKEKQEKCASTPTVIQHGKSSPGAQAAIRAGHGLHENFCALTLRSADHFPLTPFGGHGVIRNLVQARNFCPAHSAQRTASAIHSKMGN